MTAMRFAKDEELARTYAQAAYQHTTEGWLNTLNVVQDRLAADSALARAVQSLPVVTYRAVDSAETRRTGDENDGDHSRG